MADFPTFQELFDVARAEILVRNSKLTVEAVDREGTDVNALVAAMAAMGDELIGQLSRVEVSLLLGAARAKDLDRLAFDRYRMLRKPATPAVGSVEFSTTIATASSFNIPSDLRLQSADGVQFLTTESIVFPISSTGPITVAVRAASAGLSTQARSGTITSIGDTIPGQPADLVVTNSLATAGASDAEDDDSLRARALSFFTTARRGTIEAIRQAALAVLGVQTATVFEIIDSVGRPARTVEMIITDQFTESLAQLAAVPPDYATQSQQLAETVFAALFDSRAAGIFVNVVVAKVVLQGIVLALSFRAGVDVNQVALQARARVVAAVNSLSPGMSLLRSDLTAVLRDLPGLVTTGGEVLSPVGDVVPMPLEVIRTSLGLVNASTIQPDRRLAGTANPDSV